MNSVATLTLSVIPDSAPVSTGNDPPPVDLQFAILNTGSTTVDLSEATLTVPMSTSGTNLGSGMTPEGNRDWSFGRLGTSQGDANFLLEPGRSGGQIPPSGSATFALTDVTMATAAGIATLTLSADTSFGSWVPTVTVTLTPPSTVPVITHYGASASSILQGQQVTLDWGTTGASGCSVEDDQAFAWIGLNTTGTLTDQPAVGKWPMQKLPGGNDYYPRLYTLTADSGGGSAPAVESLAIIVLQPTILEFSVTPATLVVGSPCTASWRIDGAGVDTDSENFEITLTVAPQDGTPSQDVGATTLGLRGSATVTPTPLATTDYTLVVNNGYGATASATATVTSPLAKCWVELPALGVSVQSPLFNANACCLAAFGGELWASFAPNSASGRLAFSQDAGAWTLAEASASPGWPPDGLLAADLGSGPMLWALGRGRNENQSVVASSGDGSTWQSQPDPGYDPLQLASYVFRGPEIGGPEIMVIGGNIGSNPSADIWATPDGLSWKQVSNNLPVGPNGNVAAVFGADLYSVPCYATGSSGQASSSSPDGGITWPASQPLPASSIAQGVALQSVGNQLWLLGANGAGQIGGAPLTGTAILTLDATSTWSVSTIELPSATLGSILTTTIYLDYLWVAAVPYSMAGPSTPVIYLFNQTPPGTTFTLAAPGAAAPAQPSVLPDITSYTAGAPFILQGQPVTLAWTSTGDTGCSVEDDQANIWKGQPADDTTFTDTPVKGGAVLRATPNGVRCYVRIYTLTANSAGAFDPAMQSLGVIVLQPTILEFYVTPSTLAVGTPCVVSWRVACIDSGGIITLTVAPKDGTPSQDVSLTALGITGSVTISPTPLVTTDYTLFVDNGHGVITSKTFTVTSPLAAGWVERPPFPRSVLLQTVGDVVPFLPCLASFNGELQYLFSIDGTHLAVASSPDGATWSLELQAGPPPPQGAVVVGSGVTLCAFGIDSTQLTVATLGTGGTWQQTTVQPPPNGLGEAGYAATSSGIVMIGGQGTGSVWSTTDGSTWNDLGSLPNPQGGGGPYHLVAALGTDLYDVPVPITPGAAFASTSSPDGGNTWSGFQTMPISTLGAGVALQAVGNELWLLGANGNPANVSTDYYYTGSTILTLAAGASAWTVSDTSMPSATPNQCWLATTIHLGYLWLAITPISDNASPPSFYLLNQTPPGTTFQAVPVTGAGEAARHPSKDAAATRDSP
jgi:hypothetical protein